jgi:NTE family protein
LAEAGVQPNWIAGVSIGALNTAIIAGNAPENRVEALRGFWNSICHPTDWLGGVGAWTLPGLGLPDLSRKWASMWAAGRALTEGQPGFFSPRVPLPMAGFGKQIPNVVSYYDTAALKETLLKFADFDRINDGDIRVSVGAVNVRTGNLVYFDNTKMRLEPEHFMASGALPPGFPAVEIDGEYYWDGGLVSNTPLTEVLRDAEHKDALIFQVDLWSARGNAPGDFLDVSERAKDIQYSSRTRAITNMLADRQKHARFIKELLAHVPSDLRRTDPLFRLAEEAADGSAINVVHLIYKNKPYEGHYKDYEFSVDTMREHWESGLEDIRDSFAHREWFDVPSREQGFVTHDVHRRLGTVPQSDRDTLELPLGGQQKVAA